MSSSTGENSQTEEACGKGRKRFATTRWSVVLAAARDDRSPAVKQALATLCETYWYPLYAYLRRRGCSADDAQDTIQEFFLHLLEKHSLRVADSQRGKFRSFLLASLNHFQANERRQASAQKRGGTQLPVALDFLSGEHRYALEPSEDLTPEKIYERRWALTLLETTLSRLRQEYDRRGKLELFDALKVLLSGEDRTESYREIAARLGITEGAVKVAVHRLRRRYGELLREEISQTVSGPDDVDGEIHALFDVFSE
jgi:RNA polymerase sigma-70 factor (ECF subfamily)